MDRGKTLPGRAGWFATWKARQRESDFLRRNARLVREFLLVTGLMAVIVAFLLWTNGAWGGVLGGALASWFLTTCFFNLRTSSGSDSQRRGAAAERFVEEEIERHLPPGWSVRSGISFDGFDLDHIIVGDNVVIEVETKSTGADWNLTGDGVVMFAGDPTLGAGRRLQRARQLLTGGPSTAIDGQSWLVVLAPTDDATRAQLPAQRRGVVVCSGRDLKTLVAALPPIADSARAAANIAKVDDYLRQRIAWVTQERARAAV